METLDFGLHDILIYEMRNGEGKGGKYLETGNLLQILRILHNVQILRILHNVHILHILRNLHILHILYILHILHILHN